MNSQEFVVPDQFDQARLDLFLVASLPDISRSKLQQLITSGHVTGSRTMIKPRLSLKVGERISVELPDQELNLKLVSGNLPILFEDDDLLAIDKPAGLSVHPSSVSDPTSVIQILLSMRPGIGEVVYDSTSEVSRLRPGIVHRLDKHTTGVLLVAKTTSLLHDLSNQFRLHTIHKSYLALLSGNLLEPRTVDAALARKPGRENMMGIAKDPEQGRVAITHFFPQTNFLLPNGLSITKVLVKIETGRTHQIRAHAKSIGMPVLGDRRYTNKAATALTTKLQIPRQLLHASEITITHFGKPLTIASPIPADFQATLDYLEPFAHRTFDIN